MDLLTLTVQVLKKKSNTVGFIILLLFYCVYLFKFNLFNKYEKLIGAVLDPVVDLSDINTPGVFDSV